MKNSLPIINFNLAMSEFTCDFREKHSAYNKNVFTLKRYILFGHYYL